MLDLFSGIGGFSFALHAVARTVGYCEIQPICRDILRLNMRRQRIDRAPIMEDITKIAYVRTCQNFHKLICAGFPCTDTSVANPAGKGLEGAQSGLIKHVFRLVDECDHVKYVLLENSPFIMDSWVRCTSQDVCRQRLLGSRHHRIGSRRWCPSIRGADGFVWRVEAEMI